MRILAAIWLLVTMAPAVWLTLRQWRGMMGGAQARRAALAGLAIGATLLLRPHQDTMVGLDLACYRNMARAFVEGRPIHAPDAALREAPPSLRRALLMKYHVGGRETRDRSFEVQRWETTADTRPWFYPSLPLLAVGLSTVSGGALMDYGVPLLSGCALAALLGWAARRHGGWGVGTALVLWFGSPLLVWSGRGYFAEMAALALVVIGALPADESGPPSRRIAAARGWMLGLAAAYHPLVVLTAGPLLLLMLWEATGRVWRRLVIATGFGLGTVPLLAMTEFVTQPYGHFLRPQLLVERLQMDRFVLLPALVGFLGLIPAAAAVLLPEQWHARIRRVAGHTLRSRWGFSLLCILALLLVILLCAGPWRQPHIAAGFREFTFAVRRPLGLLLTIAILLEWVRHGRADERAWFLLAISLAPIFFYFKGADPIGMWSQRRLAPLMWLIAVGFTPPLATLGRGASTWAAKEWRSRAWAPALVALGLTAAALANPLRWPAPWWLRSEGGVDRWIREMRAAIGDTLTVFDYEPLSSPLAVLPNLRVLAVNGDAFHRWPDIIAWLAQRAAAEPVRLVTAWANPGIEEGVQLQEERALMLDVPILRSRYALPAEAARRKNTLHVLRLRPIAEGANEPPTLDKRLDGGPLALRGPWDRVRPIARSGGATDSAQWTRQGSGIVGPVPPSGGMVELELWAASGRTGAEQELDCAPPWGGEPVRLRFGPELTFRRIRLRRPAEAGGPSATTGIYRFTSPTPYNPASEGLRGYAPDLGVLLHRVRIRVVLEATDRADRSDQP